MHILTYAKPKSCVNLFAERKYLERTCIHPLRIRSWIVKIKLGPCWNHYTNNSQICITMHAKDSFMRICARSAKTSRDALRALACHLSAPIVRCPDQKLCTEMLQKSVLVSISWNLVHCLDFNIREFVLNGGEVLYIHRYMAWSKLLLIPVVY